MANPGTTTETDPKNPFRYLPGWFWRPSLAVAGGLISGLSLAPINLSALIIVSVVAIHLSIRGVGWRWGLANGFLAGVAFYASQSVWMSAYLGPEPWLALSVLEGLIFAIGLGLAASTWRYLESRAQLFGRWTPLVLIFSLSLIWVAREWVAGHFPYGGYQWSRLGQPMADTLLARLAYWGGISLVSLGVALISVTVVVGLTRTRAFWTWSSSVIIAAPAIALVVTLLLTSLPAEGTARLNATKSTATRSIRVTAIQGNANAGLFANPVPGSILQKHIQTTLRWLARNPRQAAATDLVVWPENASDVDPLSNPIAAAQIHNLVDNQLHIPLMVGAVTWRGKRVFNSVLVFRPNSQSVQIYDKRRPVPFAEYVPDRPFWYQLAPDLIGLIYRGFSFGTKSGNFQVGGANVGTLICFEIGIDEIPHDLVMGGAGIILSQANNSDFGHTAEAFQQEALVRLQAVATGRAIVHASTVATTEIVGPDGSVLASTKPFTPAWANANVAIRSGLTPAMAWFGWVDKLALVAALLALIASLTNGILGFSRRQASVKSTLRDAN